MPSSRRTERARELRRSMTDEERRLWAYLRKRQFDGIRFRRQVPVGPYFADFLCRERSLVIEVDGGQHTVRREYDERRTRFLAGNGFRVLRFWNHEVNDDLDAVLDEIGRVILERRPDASEARMKSPPPLGEGQGGSEPRSTLQTHSPPPLPSPRGGGGKS